MSMYAHTVCDGCATAVVDIPLPETKALVRMIEALHDAQWVTPLPRIWLCPACAAITNIAPVQDTTGSLFEVADA